MNSFGIDEVGRGCWAGPLVAAAVSLSRPVTGLNDSKKLSAKRRAELVNLINQSGITFVVEIDNQTIDQIGLTAAMRSACEQLHTSIATQTYDQIIIDGNINFLEAMPDTRCQIGADASVAEVMAASIIAKEYRDSLMREHARTYPEYGFEQHVGYGTAAHRQALEQHGATPLHRLSFKPLRQYA